MQNDVTSLQRRGYWQNSRWQIAGAAAGGIAAVIGLALYAGQPSASQTGLLSGFLLYFLSTMAMGISFGWLIFKAEHRLTFSEIVMSGIAYGAAAWAVLGLVLVPVLAGRGPQWGAMDAGTQFPLLILYLLQGIVLALVIYIAQQLNLLPAVSTDSGIDTAIKAEDQRHVVIIGGGFAGVTTAQELEKQLGDDRSVRITLISQTNHLLFTPMLAEVTSGGVEAQHISPALRTFFRHVDVIRGELAGIDADHQLISVKSGDNHLTHLTYDQLVLAVGAIPNFFGNRNLERYSFTFKTLADAIQIRNHIIDCLERADSQPNLELRQAMLTFVVVGAGFAGSELVGGLNDFIRGSLTYYKQLRNEDITVLLLHPGERILPELSESLATYAEAKMTARGVAIRGGALVTNADRRAVMIGDETIATETLIWTAGNVPNPMLKTIGVEVDRRGAVMTDEYLCAKGKPNIWAVGDCAAIPDVLTGKNAPPTAQYALREAKTLAYNLHAILHKREPKQFRHKSQGSLAVVGHQTACAEVFGMKFSGLLAWLMWRGIYLAKLPTLEKKVRVLLDWVIDIFFPRDITYTPLVNETAELTPAIGD